MTEPVVLTQIPADDPRVIYDRGVWHPWPVENSSSRYTTKANATASLTFNGTLIVAYGIVNISSGQATYQLDCTNSSTPKLPPPSNTSLPLYPSQNVDNSEHQLTVTAMDEGQPFILSHFVVATSGEITGRPVDKFMSCLNHRDFDSVGQDQSTDSSVRPLPVGAIAGIVVGSVLFLALVTALAVCQWRRRRCPRKTTLADNGFAIIEIDNVNLKRHPLYDFMSFKAPDPLPGSVPPISNTFTPTSASQSSAMFSSVIMIPPFPSTTTGSVPDTNRN